MHAPKLGCLPPKLAVFRVCHWIFWSKIPLERSRGALGVVHLAAKLRSKITELIPQAFRPLDVGQRPLPELVNLGEV
jgi:hypothetical protein